MPPLEVTLDLLEQTTPIAGSMDWGVEFVQQGVHGGFASAVALKGDEVAIYDLLGIVDGTDTIRGCKADQTVNGFVKVFHPASSAVRC